MFKRKKRLQITFSLMMALASLLGSAISIGAFPQEGTTGTSLRQVVSSTVKRDVTYCTVGGEALKMDVYLPKVNGRAAPTVIYVHGGSWVSGDKYEIGLAGDTLALKGYVVASINYRLAPAYKWPAQIQDTKCAIRYLRASATAYGIDANRIAVWGSSAGGHLAALAGLAGPEAGFDTVGGYTNQSSHVQAVVDMFGPTDLTAYNPDEFALGVGQAVFGISPGQPSARDLLTKASPISYVSKGAPPFLILHGDKDTLVPLGQSQALYDKLKATGNSAELIVVKNAGHGFVPTGGTVSPSPVEIANIIQNFLDRSIGANTGGNAGANTQPNSQLFPRTGQSVGGAFLSYWQAHGGLTQFGYPLTGEVQERSEADGKLYTMQYFERAVFEKHPENAAPNDVLLSLLGVMQYKQKYPNSAPNQVPNMAAGSALFPPTGKRVGGAFLDYWHSHGGVAQQGYPISEEFSEVSPVDGRRYTVQYFERVVFEFHPENKAPYNVLLSPLGVMKLKVVKNGNQNVGAVGRYLYLLPALPYCVRHRALL